MESRSKKIAAGLIALLVLLGGIGALCLFNKSIDLLNSEFDIIVTGSMDGEPHPEYEIQTIPVNSLIAVHKANGSMSGEIAVGDVIGFPSPMVKGNVFHRVIAIDDVNRQFTTQGDNTHSTETVPFEKLYGKVVNVSPEAGAVITFVKTHIVFIAIVIIILAITFEAVSYVLKLGRNENNGD